MLASAAVLTDRLVTSRRRGANKRPENMSRPSSTGDHATRRQILTKAAELFLSKGYKGVSMKMLAQAVEVTAAALYYHFPEGKEELFTAMIQAVFVDDGLARIDETLAAAHGFRDRLTQLTSTLVALPLDERLSLLLRDAREHLEEPEHQRVILSLLDGIKRHVKGIFQEAHDAGEIRGDLPVNVLVGLYMGMLREGKGMRTADRAAAVVRVLLDGIAKERSPLP